MPTTPVTIDVIIPAYNAEKYIAETIQSVLSQSYPVSSIIVVDDCSTDGTVALVESLQNPKIKIVQHEKNAGVSTARNTGIKNAMAEYVAFLDADDVWEADKIEKQMAVFLNSTFNPGVVYCGYEHIDQAGKEISSDMTKPRVRGQVFQTLLSGNYISGSASSVLIKKECIDQTGLFRTDLFYGEDWDYWLRLAKNYSFDYVDEALVKIRIHGQNAQHGQIADKDRLAKLLDQELSVIAPWMNEYYISYKRYLIYFNRRYMAGKENGIWDKLRASAVYINSFFGYYRKYFVISYSIILLYALKRSIKKSMGK